MGENYEKMWKIFEKKLEKIMKKMWKIFEKKMGKNYEKDVKIFWKTIKNLVQNE